MPSAEQNWSIPSLISASRSVRGCGTCTLGASSCSLGSVKSLGGTSGGMNAGRVAAVPPPPPPWSKPRVCSLLLRV